MRELEIIQHQHIDGFSVFFDKIDYRTPHIHPEWELIWILENDLSVSCRNKQYLVHPGQMVLFNPNEPHEFHKIQDGCLFLCLQISPTVLPAMLPIFVDANIIDTVLRNDQIEQIKKYLADIMRAYLIQKDHFALYCVGTGCLILHQLLDTLPTHLQTEDEMENIGKRNTILKRLITYVDENYMHKIRLTDFAVAEGYSVSYLSRFIKNTLNQSFQEYVTSVRFHNACKLIAEGGKKMLEVCMESGFSDYRYFSQAFRQQYGMTPESYRAYSKRQHLESAAVRHSLHSVERFYSRDESLMLTSKFFK